MRILLPLLAVAWSQGLQSAFIGAVTDTTARLQVLGPPSATVEVQISPNPTFSSAISQNIILSPEGFGRADFSSLSPDTRYFWQALWPGVDTLQGTFQTFPTLTAKTYLKFAFGSCQAFGYTPPTSEPIFQVIAQDTPRLFIQCGDWGYPDLRYNRLPHDSTTFAQWWDTIVAAYQVRYQGTDIQRLFKVAPIDYVYDDHDFISNNASGTTMPHISTGLIREFIFPPHARRNIIQAYSELFPHYPLPDTSAGIFHRIRMGNVEIFVCDNRSARSPDLNALEWRGDTAFFMQPPGHTMLGASQLQWLLDGLRTSDATWKFVVTGVAFNRGYRQFLQALSGNYALQQCDLAGMGNGAMLFAALLDTWGGYAAEQDSILDYCRRWGLSNIIWLSGDSHTSAIDDGTNAGFPELMAGNLRQQNSQLAWLMANADQLLPAICPAANLSQSLSVWNAGGQGLGNTNFNDAYGKVEVFGDDSVRLSIVDVQGATIASLTLRSGTSAALTGRPFLPGNRFQIYPSPARDKLFVRVDPALLSASTPLYLTNAVGQVVEKYLLTPSPTGSFTLSVEKLPPGLYFAVLWRREGPYVRTFLKE